jgi:hypothetical protein
VATYEQFRAMLPVFKHRLDDELEVQAQIMEQISTEVVRRNAQLLESKQELDKIDGRLAEEAREDEPKSTVGAIAAKVKRDPDRVSAWMKYLACLSEHGRWEGLREAWKQKGFSIKTLADLYHSQYFQLSSTQSRERTDRADTQAEGRKALRIAGRHSVASPDEQAEHDTAEGKITPRRRSVSE